MNPRSLFGALGIAAIVATSAAAASAQAYPPGAYGQGYRQASLVNVANIARNCGHTIARLQRDPGDYGGHRVAAIGDLQNAANELNAAEQFAVAHGYQMPVQGPPGRNPSGYHPQPTMRYTSMQRAQMAVQRWIRHLERDSRDFGGHRVAAINWLQRAESELTAAVQFGGARPY